METCRELTLEPSRVQATKETAWMGSAGAKELIGGVDGGGWMENWIR